MLETGEFEVTEELIQKEEQVENLKTQLEKVIIYLSINIYLSELKDKMFYNLSYSIKQNQNSIKPYPDKTKLWCNFCHTHTAILVYN